MGGNYEVAHHSQLIAELIADGRISLEGASSIAAGKVTYHDPCYLGRYNKVYDEPRSALKSIPIVELTEMPRNRNQSFCCGGGGRSMMKEDSGSRINIKRVREALHTGVQVVAASCPFCMGMLEDGIVGQNATDKLRVVDVAELVAASLKTPAQGNSVTSMATASGAPHGA